MKKRILIGALVALAALLSASRASAQTEVMAWSNITGVRVDGELIDFETSIRAGAIGGRMYATGRERQNTPLYHRDGAMQQVITPLIPWSNPQRARNRQATDGPVKLGALTFEQKVTDLARGKVAIALEARSDTTLRQPAYFCLSFGPDHYADATFKTTSRSLSVVSATRNVQLKWNRSAKTQVVEENGMKVVYIELASAQRKGATYAMKFDLSADGTIDSSDARVTIDPTSPGYVFAGFGGNFRIQNPSTDPLVIDYCLNDMRVAFGRVEMPWRNWDPDENADPLERARLSGVDAHTAESLEMARRLKEVGMPVIVSAWFPPEWAGLRTTRSDGSSVAYALDSQKKDRIFRSLASYFIYLKRYYGVEPDYFSFNESDLGINVIHTPDEHRDFIKEFGAYLASQGLKTLLLLGDNSDATTIDFIGPAMRDPACRRYIGAVSFHSWRGCDDVTLRRWAAASRELNVPLLVAEGSTDAAAWRYPEIFGESTFALYEINLYTRICAIAQPWSILQWQLTADYSPFFGEGIFRTTGPLRPTQRYWNLKQLSMTPEDAFALPFRCDKATVNAAAFGNIARGEYAVHLVNNGAACVAEITGLPAGVSRVRVYTTNAVDSMRESVATVSDGRVRVPMAAVSFVSVLAETN